MEEVFVIYPGSVDARFDREYYVSTHLPLVMESWAEYGLESVAAFFPPSDGAGTIAICICVFRDAAAVKTAFDSPQSEHVMADIVHFTDAKPAQRRAVPL